ncbi:MAG TPA: hypothetical protein PKM65_14625 [Spirochaetota bacterium]|nr:hypothetical protein [Spirochaetota bacterium]
MSIFCAVLLAFALMSVAVGAEKEKATSPEKKVESKKSAGKKKAVRAKVSGASFYGKIIFLGADGCEVKSGKRELSVAFAPDTVFIAKDGSKKDKAILELCQMVKVVYARKGKENVLKRIAVVKPGTCAR